MVVIQGAVGCYNKLKRHSCSAFEGDENRVEKACNGLNADLNSLRWKDTSLADMLLQLKSVAKDPCNPMLSLGTIQESLGLIIERKTIWSLYGAEAHWKKQKLHHFLQTSPATFDSTTENSSRQRYTRFGKRKCSFAQTSSCLFSCDDSTESSNQPILQIPERSVKVSKFGADLPGKWDTTSSSSQDDAMDGISPPNKKFSPLVDSEDSINCSNLQSSEKSNLQTPYGSAELLKYGNSFPAQRVCASPTIEEDLADWTSPCNEDVLSSPESDDSIGGSNPSSPNKTKQLNKTPRRSIWVQNFIGDYLPKLAIPIGPRFQADVPNWNDLSNKESLLDDYCKSDNSRWLGTQIWPIGGKRTKNNRRVVGKGRPESCSCVSPGSEKCIKRHIVEESVELESDLGPAFLSWRINEMGEEVSKSWTFKEESSFNTLVKMTNNSGKNFLKLALKTFPCKSRESIVSYYFNVFDLRLMRKETRSASGTIENSAKTRYLVGVR